MKIIKKAYLFLFVSIMFFTTHFLNAQRISINPQNSTLTILGTSNVHDWEMKVSKINSEIVLNESKQLSELIVKIPVTSIKSGKSIMDDKTYDAFNYKKYPTIVFQLTEASPVKITDKEDEITLTGNLSMAGETRKISFKTNCKSTKQGEYHLKGSVPLKMTDFKMTPPTAMFGAMKTGNAVNVKFEVTYNLQ